MGERDFTGLIAECDQVLTARASQRVCTWVSLVSGEAREQA